MKTSTLFTLQLAALSAASPHVARQYETADPHAWIPAGPNDFRGPCPMLNTLSNHGFFPRDGRNITKYNAVKGLTGGLNFAADLAEVMWEQAIIANPEPNATFFTLDQLNVHNLLEHDASLTRTDAALGSNHIFNETIYKTTRRYFTADVLTAEMIANAKIFRQVESRATNPTYKFTNVTEAFSLGEMSAPFIAFGDLEAMTVPRNLVEYWLTKERLPTELGWSRKENVISMEDISTAAANVGKATNLFTGSTEAVKVRRGDFHAGMKL